jgi:ribosomal-protein-alanine N-acetyltransferase
MNEVFNVELARTNDAHAIAAMSRDYIEAGLPWSWRATRVLRAIRATDTNVLVARRGNDIVGFAIMRYGPLEAGLQLFAVRPTERRRGIGTALIQWLIEAARVAGIYVVYVEMRADNAVARSFYRDRGFEDMEPLPSYYSNSLPGHRMAYDLRKHPV